MGGNIEAWTRPWTNCLHMDALQVLLFKEESKTNE
jgi:hypothetical protein